MIEWRFSARELAALLQNLRDVPALAINPGLASRADWRSIAFKGGSEAACVNLSTLVTNAHGTRHVAIATWNGQGAGVERLAAPYTFILQASAHDRG